MAQLPLSPALLALKLGQFDSIQHLVVRRFGFVAIIPPGSAVPTESRLLQQWLQAQEFRSELEKYTPEKIQQLLSQAIEEDWRQKPEADFVHHAKLSYWTLEEALALSFGKAPTALKWNEVQNFVGRSPLVTEFAKRREIIQRAQQMGQLWEQTIPYVFMAWADRMSFPMPQQLVAEIKALGIQIMDWKTAHDEKASKLADATAEIGRLRQQLVDDKLAHMASLKEVTDGWKEVLKTQEDIVGVMRERLDKLVRRNEELENQSVAPSKSEPTPRERQSLLKLALGMAMKKYRYDPVATKNSATKHIADDLRELGTPLDEDTIRKYLNEGKELLGEVP